MTRGLAFIRSGLRLGQLADLIFHRILVALYYRTVTLINPERLPVGKPVIYLGLHRNGAVDGFVYSTVLPRAVFMISAQLRRNLIGRLFFKGIEVSRTKDMKKGISCDNRAAIQTCIRHVTAGGELFIMPEGTSDLGFQHLPFHKSAARVLTSLLYSGITPEVIPLGIHYEKAWAWQSRVEVVAGERVCTVLPYGASEAEAVRLLHQRITAALEAVGVNAPDEAVFHRWERVACVSTLATGRSYFSELKALEQGWPVLEAQSGGVESGEWPGRVSKNQGDPTMPVRRVWAPLLQALAVVPLVVASMLANFPPLLVAWFAGYRLADGPNTIALWRLLPGFLALVTWSACLLAAATVTGNLVLWPAYVFVSIFGLCSVHRVKKLLVFLCSLRRVRAFPAELSHLHKRTPGRAFSGKES